MSKPPSNPHNGAGNRDGDDDSRGRYGNAGYNDGLAVFSYIIGGIIVWSLIGWGLDNLLGTRWLVLAGGLLGALGGFYLSFKHNLTRSDSSGSGPSPGDRPGTAEGPQRNVE